VRRQPNENDVIRKIVNRQAAHISIIDTWNEAACRRKLLEMLKCLANLAREVLSRGIAPFAVPVGRFAELAACSRAEANTRQRESTSR
jgi:uncharacterized ferritin-like protein (DUF455 family)